ncbi:MAG: putative metal-binding motif-containing protein [Myxococcota bacterium]|nr:putative metal-binding motif-containing protein [Myxococcota bacterium]
MSRIVILAACAAVLGCSSDGAAPDATTDAPAACRSDDDCSDGVYCNGEERCDDSTAGCVAGTPPCDGACDEVGDSCEEGCVDGDRDGQADVICGGTDCDDSDANVFQGATEVCDSAGIDDDCDPSTLGPDGDGDGFVSTRCCNGPAATQICGTDCDDGRPAVNPDAPETCNGMDDDCDGSVDEAVTLVFYRDVDGDNYGDATMTVDDCSAPSGYALMPGDCDDTRRTVFPGSDESCVPGPEGPLDEDCDGETDEGCDCTPGTIIACGPGAPFAGVGICRDGTQRCSSAGTYETCSGVSPVAETCNGDDDDCDSRLDEGEGRVCARSSTVVGTTVCGREGTRTCGLDCQWIQASFLAAEEEVSSCDYCADTAGGIRADRAFATSTRTVGRYTELYGSATTSSLSDQASERGSAWTVPFTVGYGNVVVDVQVRAAIAAGTNPTLGWALGLVVDDPAAPTIGGLFSLGFPSGRTGWRAEWRHAYSDITGGQPTLVRLRSLPDFTLIAENRTFLDLNMFGLPIRPPGPTNRDQRLRLEIIPDDPETSGTDETSVLVFAGGTTPGMIARCANERPEGLPACGLTLRPGTNVRALVSAEASSAAGSLVTHSVRTTTTPSASAASACP